MHELCLKKYKNWSRIDQIKYEQLWTKLWLNYKNNTFVVFCGWLVVDIDGIGDPEHSPQTYTIPFASAQTIPLPSRLKVTLKSNKQLKHYNSLDGMFWKLGHQLSWPMQSETQILSKMIK